MFLKRTNLNWERYAVQDWCFEQAAVMFLRQNYYVLSYLYFTLEDKKKSWFQHVLRQIIHQLLSLFLSSKEPYFQYSWLNCFTCLSGIVIDCEKDSIFGCSPEAWERGPGTGWLCMSNGPWSASSTKVLCHAAR